ncbi:hypothetical protein [Limosilactobacillus antri]|uniref:ABM domain-containing protein n=1 Tax=Limosilactobacillus antri DSM 16041 TaxID=525309 RepID=C8P7K9_9LACO|nr:hypothetical protein [Limosilactobacillus antri]EEW53513.1 hypothetical protein HMPREF0494_1303 [Limosilactobacillus antri DSM 16041]KRK54200.1 hypothetical protein FC31_GL001642 [Limosilactobacillus antri DSM 16041]
MLTKLSFTFGSHQILQGIIDEHPDREFKLMQASTHSNKLALFDLSNQDSIFKNPVILTVLDETMNSNYNGLFYYQSFQVNGDRQQVLYNSLQKVIDDQPAAMNAGLMTSVANKSESSTLVLITVWDRFEDLTAWKESDSFANLTNFTTMGSDNYYYDEVYRSVR